MRFRNKVDNYLTSGGSFHDRDAGGGTPASARLGRCWSRPQLHVFRNHNVGKMWSGLV